MTNTHDRAQGQTDAGSGIAISGGPQIAPWTAEVHQAVCKAAWLPSMDINKVEEMRARLAAGSYAPSAEQMADAILARANTARLCR
ncbi:MAG TPA: flagellar biosynthesis anti-sigma factor FlgM [Armatimonadota bacterium]|jgi:anti-sigma28 factor (negative regulator of flagellin synthesis)